MREKAQRAKMSEGDPRVSQIFLHDRLSNLPTRCAVEFRQETSIRMRNGTGLPFYGCFRVDSKNASTFKICLPEIMESSRSNYETRGPEQLNTALSFGFLSPRFVLQSLTSCQL